MGLFGKGLSTAMELQERILRALGAEEEWVERGDGEADFAAWMTGAAATFFHTQPTPQDTPDLGVLRIVTPVAAGADGAAGYREADRLNRQATVSRWAFVTTKDKTGQALALVCSFVVGPHNLDDLTAFAVWCAREQIATATAALEAGVAKTVGDGTPYGWGGHSTRGSRAEPHPVTRPALSADETRGGSSAVLAEHAYAASTALLDQMAQEGTARWGRWTDAPILTFEVPMSWDDYPEGLIGKGVSDETPPTAIVEATRDDHPDAGNGLRLSMTIPWRPLEDVEVMVAEMNAMAGDTPSASHILGAWSIEDYPVKDEHGTIVRISPNYRYNLYLPATLTEKHNEINLPAVMREALLTFARMALIARRMHGPRTGLRDDDYMRVGFDAPEMPHGLAWGETGEGRNPGALALDAVYGLLVGADDDWAYTREDGFAWWPADHLQSFKLYSGEEQVPALSMYAEVRHNVPVTPDALTAVARLNYDLGLSSLVLAAEGDLLLAASLPVGGFYEPHFPLMAQVIAADQFVTARDLRSVPGDLSDFGEPTVSAHPFSGTRPPDESRFALRQQEIVPLAEKARADLAPRVALLAVLGQVFMPHEVSVRDDGGVDYAWRLSQFADEKLGSLGDPLVQGSVFPGQTPVGPGWIVRTRLPVTGDLASRARWCNQQNIVLLSPAAETARLVAPGGWGLSPDGDCCLTSWLPPFPDSTEVGRVAYVGRVAADHAEAVQSALVRTEPGGVTSSSATQAELTAGLTRTLAAARSVLEYPADFRCAVDLGPAGVTLTLSAPEGDLAAFAEVLDDSSERTVVHVPASANRTELAIAYAALLGRSASRIDSGDEFDVVPGELARWEFSAPTVRGAIDQLCKAGVIEWPQEETVPVFPAGQRLGHVWVESMPSPRLHGAEPIRIVAEANGLALADTERRTRDTDVLGTWRQTEYGTRYEVIVPAAGLVWNLGRVVSDLLAWLMRHVISQVQSAAEAEKTRE